MLGQLNHLSLSQRATFYYWLTFSTSVAALLVGLILINWQQQRHDAETACLAQLQRTVTSLELQLLRQVPDPFSVPVTQLSGVGRVQYCCVVSPAGRYLAHTEPRRIGQLASEPSGRTMGQLADPSLLGLRWKDASGRALREYRKPLGDDGGQGQIRVAIEEPTLAQSVQGWSHLAPRVLIAPLLIGLFGARLLRRALLAFAPIERQLTDAATAPEVLSTEFRPVACSSASSLGWNRLVEHVDELRGQRPLEEVLTSHLGSQQSRDLEQIISGLPDGIAVTDGSHNIKICNAAFGTLLGSGTDSESQTGRPMQALFASGDGQDGWETLSSPDSDRRVVVSEILRGNASEERWLRIARHPLNAGNAESGSVWTVRDVTQQKLADKMRDQFLDSATHELRTPLANIKAYAETLAVCDDVDQHQYKDLCNTIDSEVTRLARFIDELLDVSSLEVGSLTIQRKNADLARLLPDLLEKVQPLMQKKEISFEVTFPEKLPELSIDKDKVTASLVNLLGNAAKYTPRGGVVRFHVDRGDDRVDFTIEDTGIGIAEEELGRVFDKFFRSHDPRVQAETGTGLGLALAKQVFELHGGSLMVTSQAEQGSTFVARLPVVTAQFCSQAP